MSDIVNVRDRRAIDILNSLLNTNFIFIGDRNKEWDAEDHILERRLEFKSHKRRDGCFRHWVMHEKDVKLDLGDRGFTAWDRLFPNSYDLSERFVSMFYVPKEYSFNLVTYLNERMEEHLAKNPKNKGINLSRNQLLGTLKKGEYLYIYKENGDLKIDY